MNLKAKDQVFRVYSFNPEHIHSQQKSFARLGSFRYTFLSETIDDLSLSLLQRGVNLRIFDGCAGLTIPHIVHALRIDKMWATKEHTLEELSDGREVKHGIRPLKRRLFNDRTLIDPDRFPFAIGHLSDVFTEFRKKWKDIPPSATCFPLGPK